MTSPPSHRVDGAHPDDVDGAIHKVLSTLLEKQGEPLQDDVAYARAQNGRCLVCNAPGAEDERDAYVLLVTPDLGHVTKTTSVEFSVGSVHGRCWRESGGET